MNTYTMCCKHHDFNIFIPNRNTVSLKQSFLCHPAHSLEINNLFVPTHLILCKWNYAMSNLWLMTAFRMSLCWQGSSILEYGSPHHSVQWEKTIWLHQFYHILFIHFSALYLSYFYLWLLQIVLLEIFPYKVFWALIFKIFWLYVWIKNFWAIRYLYF